MKDLLKTAYDAMDEKQAEDLKVIDFRKQSPFMDYFIIGTAKNFRMARAIIENVEEKVLSEGYEVKHSYVDDSKWLLIDLGEVVCHVFYDGQREYYNLEGLWKDLPTVKM